MFQTKYINFIKVLSKQIKFMYLGKSWFPKFGCHKQISLCSSTNEIYSLSSLEDTSWCFSLMKPSTIWSTDRSSSPHKLVVIALQFIIYLLAALVWCLWHPLTESEVCMIPAYNRCCSMTVLFIYFVNVSIAPIALVDRSTHYSLRRASNIPLYPLRVCLGLPTILYCPS